MKIVLCTLVLNEMQWLPRLYDQHKDWPGLVKWIFVEAVDRVYAETNPTLYKNGSSVDGTSDFLMSLCNKDLRVIYVSHGISNHRDPAQGKCAARQRYLDVASFFEPDFLYHLDADEFYTKQDQERINELLERVLPDVLCSWFATRDIWHPESIKDRPLLGLEATGGRFFGMTHTRFWRWKPGLRYVRSHNWPEDDKGYLTRSVRTFDKVAGAPQCVHMGWASDPKLRKAKNDYYVARGEGKKDGREAHVEARRSWETWQPGDKLPCGARVIPYNGPVPECFQS
jgi:hypothetical protein